MNVEATGRHEIREGQNLMVLTRTFHAPIADVWAAVTEPDRMSRWIGTWEGDPASGSVQFRMTAEGEDVAEQPWEIKVCEPPHTLLVHTADDSGGWDLGLHLTEQSGLTTLEFTQVIHDPAVVEMVGPGWEYYLDRLVAAETAQDLSAIDFDRDYYPAMRTYYASLLPEGR